MTRAELLEGVTPSHREIFETIEALEGQGKTLAQARKLLGGHPEVDVRWTSS